MNQDFKQYAEDLDSVEVCRICINPDGEFYVPNERDGRIARVTAQRGRLREFLLELCKRLECPNPEHAESRPAKATAKRSAA